MTLAINLNDAASSSHKLAYTIDETVKLSGIGRSYIFKAMREGKLPARKSGRRNIILYADLKKYLESLPVREVV